MTNVQSISGNTLTLEDISARGPYKTIEEVDGLFLRDEPLKEYTVEEEETMTEQTVTEEKSNEEEVKMTNTQEELLVELIGTLEVRHIELTSKFEDTIALAKTEAASGSVELAETYKAIAEVVGQQLNEVEVKLTSAKKKLTRVRAAKVVAAPVIVAVEVTKVAVKVVKVVVKSACVVGKIVVRSGKKIVSFVLGLFGKKKVKSVVSSSKSASTVVVSKAKVLTSKSKSIAKSVASRVASASRKVSAVVLKGCNATANFVLGTSIVVFFVSHKAGLLLSQAASIVRTRVKSSIDTFKGFRRGAVA